MRKNLLKNGYQHLLLSNNQLRINFSAHTMIIFQEGEMMLKEGDTANSYFILECVLTHSFICDLIEKIVLSILLLPMKS